MCPALLVTVVTVFLFGHEVQEVYWGHTVKPSSSVYLPSFSSPGSSILLLLLLL